MGDFESIVSKDSLSSSSSRSVNETINGSHEFTVKGYSLAKGMGAGKCLPSDIFAVGGYDWAIYFYPDGKNPEDNSMYVSAFIALASEGTDVRALFALTLVDQSGKEKHKVHSHFERSLEGGPYTLKYRGSMWGYKRFFKRTSLETSDYLKDDTLIMRCTVGVVRTRLEGPKRYSIPVPPSDMGKGFSDLLNTEVACDVTFFCGDKSFKAHKLVLAARSSVFRAQFFCPNADPDSDRVEVNNVIPSIFKAILHFIYTDELPDTSLIEEEVSSCSSIKIVQELLKACDLYKLDRLKLLCESKLCEELSPETVAVMLSLAEQHKFVQLKAICLKFASSPGNLGAVMQSEGFKRLEEEYPALLCELLKAFASGDEASSTQSGRKRSGSSIYGLDIAAEGAAESINPPSSRRVRRRF